jgi:hypothetical protein
LKTRFLEQSAVVAISDQGGGMTGEERQRVDEVLARMQRAVVHLWDRDPDQDEHVRTLAHAIRELKRLLGLESTPERGE